MLRSICLLISSALLGLAGLLYRAEQPGPGSPGASAESVPVRELESSEAALAKGQVQGARWFTRCRALADVCFRESGNPCVCRNGVPILSACFLCTLHPLVRRCTFLGLRCRLVPGVIHPCGMQEVGQCQVVTCNCLGTGGFLGPCAPVRDEC